MTSNDSYVECDVCGVGQFLFISFFLQYQRTITEEEGTESAERRRKIFNKTGRTVTKRVGGQQNKAKWNKMRY